MSRSSTRFRELASSSSRELEAILREGEAPEIGALLGYEYRGFNHPRFTAMLGAQKFIKGFFEADEGNRFGFNRRTKQNGLDGPWVARGKNESAPAFAFFRVTPADEVEGDHIYPHHIYPRAVLLDYGAGSSRKMDPARLLRDYLVRVDNGSDDLLLGKAYLAAGDRRITVGFFLLERHQPFELDSGLTRRVL
jgi:hypothetical protein